MKSLSRSFLRRTPGVLLAALTGACTLHAQVTPSIEWQKSLGGSDDDIAYSIQQTNEGGFIIAGSSASPDDGDVTGNHGATDYWILKLDTDGNMSWQKSLGGSDDDEANSVQQTADGGFIVAGYSNSPSDGDITGALGDKDYWIVKLDTAGNLLWQKCLGGTGSDVATSVEQTSDGGFIVAGYSFSTDGFVTGNHGQEDYWIVKLDTGGNISWQKSLGGTRSDQAYSVQQCSDGGFIVAGESHSTDGDITTHHGTFAYPDCWVVKLDSSGNLVWQNSLGGSDIDYAYSIQQIADGGFIVAGTSNSNGGNVSGNHGAYDYWVVKLDGSGNLVWQKSLGGTSGDRAYSVQQTSDGGFIVAGDSKSDDIQVSGFHGGTDFGDEWIVKLNSAGDLVWQECLGGSSEELANSIQQTNDGGFIVAGLSNSNNGDVSGNHGLYDYWIVKLSRDSISGIAPLPNTFISLYPNPVQTQLSITLATPINEVIIRVYDLQGRMIVLPTTFSGELSFDETKTQAQLNTSSLSDGFYTLQIINNKTGESKVGMFVRQ